MRAQSACAEVHDSDGAVLKEGQKRATTDVRKTWIAVEVNDCRLDNTSREQLCTPCTEPHPRQMQLRWWRRWHRLHRGHFCIETPSTRLCGLQTAVFAARNVQRAAQFRI